MNVEEGEAETKVSEDAAIGTRVKAARERLGWSREELAVHSGISWSGIAQVESGRRRNLRPDTLSALAGALGVTVEYLLRGGPMSAPMLQHRVLLYGSGEELVETAGPFLAEGVERSEAVLAVTTASNIKLLRTYLGADARRVKFAKAAAWYRTPASALDSYQAFSEAQLSAGAPWIRILGEPVWVGRSAEEIRLWTRYESLCNLAFATWPITLLCPYDQRSVQPEIAQQAHLTHPHTIGPSGIADNPDYMDPSEFVLEPGSAGPTTPR
jgi:transcriptional regulator with XRE-family HTH domain